MRRATFLLLVSCFVGAVSTGYWVLSQGHPEFEAILLSAPAFFAAAVCVLATSVNVLLRWFRFHFLVRRFTPKLVARDSLAVYFATLPAIMSPFFVAELVRIPLIRRRFQTPAAYLFRVWLSERLLDATVVLGCLLLVRELPYRLAWAAALVVGVGLWFRKILTGGRDDSKSFVVLSSLALTTIAWLLPMGALWCALRLLGAGTSLEVAVQAFSSGTLLGGLSGLPLGVSVTGSTMIQQLQGAGVTAGLSIVTVLIYRASTAWYAVLLGFFAVWVFRRRLIRLVKGQAEEHFDELSSEYEEEIPEHVRERLLGRKIALMTATLEEHGIAPGARGLDLGCGQGWYLAEMNRVGFHVDGTDYSSGQLEKAIVHLQAKGLGGGNLEQADAAALPFADDSYDFVYSINAVHHMIEGDAQTKALAEVARVLRPGGVFLLHEMNTENPLFRWYMGYLFPLLKRIDEGNEEWILPSRLPQVPGARWLSRVEYFTFLPDFVPRRVLAALRGLESWLEKSRLRRFSAHYQACLQKEELPSAGTPNTA